MGHNKQALIWDAGSSQMGMLDSSPAGPVAAALQVALAVDLLIPDRASQTTESVRRQQGSAGIYSTVTNTAACSEADQCLVWCRAVQQQMQGHRLQLSWTGSGLVPCTVALDSCCAGGLAAWAAEL